MPALSPTMTSGSLVNWKKNVGDSVKPGESYCDIQTDKATLDFENVTDEGYMARHIAPVGKSGIAVGDVIAILVDTPEGVTSPEVAAYVAPTSAGAAAVSSPKTAPTPTPAAPAPAAQATGRPPATPYAKVVAASLNVDVTAAIPTGGVGATKRVTADDVRRLAATGAKVQKAGGAASPPPSGAYEDIPLSAMRGVIAQRLHQSINLEVPHFYLSDDLVVDSALEVVAHLRKKTGHKIGINDFLIKAIAKANLAVPECNTHWSPDGASLRRYKTVDVSVAVSTPTGLITPIVFDADRKGIAEISADVKALAAKAREGSLLPNEYQGGTITISNLGGMGVKRFTAIINQPHSAILAVGTTQYRPKIVEVPPKDANEEAVRRVSPDGETEAFLTVTASFDHRVVDGAVGAKWMAQLREYVENPLSLLA